MKTPPPLSPRRLAPAALLLLLPALLAGLPRLEAAETVNLEATLILASSNASGGVDRALRPYEPTLRRLFKYDTYQLLQRATASAPLPGRRRMSLGGGHRLEIEARQAEGGKIRLRTRWLRGDRLLVDTAVVASRNRPTVLGGPPAEGGQGALLLILVAR